MRFTLFEPTALSPHHLRHLAVTAEAVGFDSFALNDGTFQLAETRGHYPYSTDHRPNWDIRAPFYEPLTVLPALAMTVPRLRFYTAVVKLPLHHPLLLAKQVATAAIMSGDRFALGVGASWAPEEYDYLGLDWTARAQLMEETVEALRLLLGGEPVSYHGQHIDFGSVVARPAPRRPVPILFGGHGKPSLSRAARLGDGWIAGPLSSYEELAELIAELRRLRRVAGRDWDRFEIHAGPPRGALGADAYRRLDALGVTDAMVLPIDAGGELLMDEPTRQRLSGHPVTVADDPNALYDEQAPATKVEAVTRFASTVIGTGLGRRDP
ncbi:MAG: TIGR03619 family F420-dependent LLM class oxidoreductase [Acidimicrobiales bacterium]